MQELTIHNHNRDSAGYTYVYPVISRRAGGVSVGINLNPNNACNWACIYCQVPDLVRGAAPEINLTQLEQELRDFFSQLQSGWLERNVPEGSREVKDIAFSGNGEPTSAEAFPEAVVLAGQVLRDAGLHRVRLRLITNGSLMNRTSVLQAIGKMAALNGEVWFKLDRATADGMSRINQINDHIEAVKRRLRACARQCPTWLQTCWFAVDGAPPDADERQAYLQVVGEMRDVIAGVHLYGLARQPMQPGSERLSSLPEATLHAFAEEIRSLGVRVTVNQ